MYIIEHGEYVKVDAATEKSIKAASKTDDKVKLFTEAEAKPAVKPKASAKK